jgi:hypothetical protein
MIDAATADKVHDILNAGRLTNASDADPDPKVAAARISTRDQVVAALAESCARLGLPMDAQTGTAYALGVLHTVEELDNHLGENSRCLAMHLLVLYSRAALIADREAGR